MAFKNKNQGNIKKKRPDLSRADLLPSNYNSNLSPNYLIGFSGFLTIYPDKVNPRR